MSGEVNNQLPLWHYKNFSNNNFMQGYGNNFASFGMPMTIPFTSSSNSSSENVDSYEGYLKKYEENQKKEAVKLSEERNRKIFLEEKNKEVSSIKDQIEAHEEKIKAIKDAQKADGSAIVETAKIQETILKEDGSVDKEAMKSKKKKGFFEKAGAWLSSAGDALLNIGKSFLGYDENGKWNPKKCLKNVVITAAAIGVSFIPVVGPAIGYGLLACGLASGAVGVAKGIQKLNKATTAEQEEKARQDICAGAFIGITSAFGLRGLGKAARAGSTSSSTFSVAKTRTSLTGKAVQNTSQFARDISVNAFKATGQAIKADKALIASQTGKFKFFKAWGSKISTAWANKNNWQKRYDNKYSETETKLNNKLSELTNKINNETNPVKKALLQEQKQMVKNNLHELRSLSRTKTKTDFDNLKTTNSNTKNTEKLSSYTQNTRGEYEINGQIVSKKQFNKFQNQIEKAQKQYNKDLIDLIDTKENIMRSYARKPNLHKRELNEYTHKTIRDKYNTPKKLKTGIESLENKISNLEIRIAEIEAKIARPPKRNKRELKNLKDSLKTLNQVLNKNKSELKICNSIKFNSWYKAKKNEYQLFIGGKDRCYTKEALTDILTAPATQVPLVMAQWDREYSVPMFGELTQLTPEQTKETLQQLEKEKQQLEAALKQFNSITDAKQWNTLKEQAAAQAQAQAQAQAEVQAAAQAQN